MADLWENSEQNYEINFLCKIGGTPHKDSKNKYTPPKKSEIPERLLSPSTIPRSLENPKEAPTTPFSMLRE